MNVETALIKKLIETGDYATVTDKQISDRYFNGVNKRAFKFIREHVTNYGKVPDRKTFKKHFPSYPMPEEIPDEKIQYFCDQVREKKKHNLIVDSLEDAAADIEDLKSEEAYIKLKRLILKVENEVILSDKVVVNRDTKKRLEDYEKRAKSGGMTGIPYGIDRLDYATKGANKGELTTILGYTGTGKSWFEIICAVYQAKQGYKVLFFTTEMSTKMVARRVDAVWAVLNYTRFRDGRLHKEEYQRYVEYLEAREREEEETIIIEQATGGVSQIAAKIDQYDPDMVYVDGAYLLADEESEEDDWRSLVHIWRGLHRIVLQKDIPMCVSTQSKEKKISLSAISFAKAIAADCDVIIGLEQDEQMREDKEMRVSFHKMREGAVPSPFIMNWDFDKMDYTTIYGEGKDEFREEQEKQADAGARESRKKIKDAGKERIQPGARRIVRKAKRNTELPEGVQVLD
ncbi:Replicative DNA helicase [compost metagenome]